MLSLGLTLSLIASGVDAAPPRMAETHADQPGTDKWVSVRKLTPRWSRDAPLYLTANDQTAGPQRPEEDEPAAQDQPVNGPTPISPVGVAPESPQEALPPSIVRMFDMPGAGVLTPKGTLILEPFLQYAHLTNNRVTLIGFTIVPALTVGLINVQGVSRDIYTSAIVGRYGLTNRLELEVRVPYLYRQDAITQRPIATPSTADSLSTATGHGLGDI